MIKLILRIIVTIFLFLLIFPIMWFRNWIYSNNNIGIAYLQTKIEFLDILK